ncbi:hypothetical protein [Dyadobacter arcticus]|uniref:Antibiotic biosynthesis monooxygenase n=1 Tax=Dyadobacter arcticus TaxID=1078754 RepID=A0ABX0UMG8_9BACT|nr:hypothetical protein [Dyadobacter arcticus]NIJ52640.1 hypothetical protein [Dyadobacter arcticus]
MDATNALKVITIIRVTPKEGCRAAVIDWFKSMAYAASQFDGYVSGSVFETTNDNFHQELLNVFTFDSPLNLDVWEKSEQRRQYVSMGEKLFLETERRRLSGMDFLVYQHSPNNPKTPVRWKIVLITSLTIYVIIHTILAWGHTVFLRINLPDWIWGVLSVMIMGILMTYVLMPAITRIFSRWLYSAPN